jgi:hypothetical protein
VVLRLEALIELKVEAEGEVALEDDVETDLDAMPKLELEVDVYPLVSDEVGLDDVMLLYEDAPLPD